jgi:hypothetical protein
MLLQSNLRVKISSDGIGEAIGRIEDIRPPAEMPYLSGIEHPRAVLEEWGVSRVAMISYYAAPSSQFVFMALEIGGEWWDLKRRKLSLEVVGRFD